MQNTTEKGGDGSTAQHQRDLRLDFFRGLALWLIFIDHIPENVVSRVTLRNYGFSDAAEIFVFISGYSAAVAYSRAMRDQGFLIAAARILKRVWQLYVAFVLLLAVFFAQIAYVARTFENPLFAEEMNIIDLLKRPDVTLPRALMLQFNPVNMDILPVYIVLLLTFPFALWLLLRAPTLTLGLSLALYVAAGQFDWYFTAYPQGYWVINPLHWQLLFVFGAWCALGGAQKLSPVLKSPTTIVLAIAYLVFAFLIVRSWYYPRLSEFKPGWLHDFLYPIDKTNLDPLRFIHFACYAVLAAWLVPKTWSALRSPWLRPAILCGQHSLEIFCLGVFLSSAAYFVITETSGGWPMQIVVSLAGVAIMVAVAAWLDFFKIFNRKYGFDGRAADADIAGGYA